MMGETIIVSMTTWPPRYKSCLVAMAEIARQRDKGNVDAHCVLVLSEDEWKGLKAERESVLSAMAKIKVEVLWDKGNIRSHKKLIPTLAKYPNNPILVVDDDNRQKDGWLRTFASDHKKHPEDIIYGQANSYVTIADGRIHEVRERQDLWKGDARLWKPANGASGTLYPAGTFTDARFFDRELFMRLSPTSDETWQWAFCTMKGCTYRCLSAYNIPYIIKAADQECALYNTNKHTYDEIHNRIASEVEGYYECIVSLTPSHNTFGQALTNRLNA